HTTAPGYAAGFTPNPTYEDGCSGRTGHTEVIPGVGDPAQISYRQLLVHFWENHDPTQGYRQGNDVGSQYRSMILTDTPAQAETARETAEIFAPALAKAGFGEITTEIVDLHTTGAGRFYYAGPVHPQDLHNTPH